MSFQSKLPHQETSIFSVMSQLAAQEDAINLSQGFPNFDCDPALISLVHKYMLAGQNQYAPMPGLLALRLGIANKIKALYNIDIDPGKEITITSGATQAIYNSIQTLVHPGDEVIIIEPAYDAYHPAIKLCGGTVIPYILRAPDFKIDWIVFAKLITSNTKLIIVNTPHNPTATRLDKSDLDALNKLLADSSIYLLSDEVYEHLVFDDEKHATILSYPDLYKRSFITYSFGKTFHATGWKIGYCIAPPMLTEEFRKIHQFTVFSVNTPIQHALAEYIQNPENYLPLSNFYQRKRDLFLAAMKDSPLRPLHSAGTYYALFDYSAVSDLNEFDFAQQLTKEKKVATIPISAFYSNKMENKVIRICFAKRSDTLLAAAKRLSNF